MSLVGRGAGKTFTVYLLPVSATFGWDRAEVISVYSLAALATGVASPFVGRLFDRSGPRTVFGLGLLLLGAGFSGAAFTEKLWQLQVSIGLAAGLGSACLGNITGSLLLSRWFGSHLPAAMAVVYSAAGAGILILVPLSQILIDHFGWRGASSYYGCGTARQYRTASSLAVAAACCRLGETVASGPNQYRRRALDPFCCNAPPCILGTVQHFFLHCSGGVRHLGSGRGLSD